MSKHILTIVKIYGPIIISAIFLFLLFSIRENQDLGRIEINPKLFGISILKYELAISNIWLARTILLCITLGVLTLLIFRDYSQFFPDHLKMEVFFDRKGIRNSLKVFSTRELEQIGVPRNYEQFQNRYYDDMNVEIRKIFQKDVDFLLGGDDIHGQGETSFYTEKLPGVQKYQIKESKGILTYSVEKPNQPKFQFTSIFDKLESPHDYLAASLVDIFVKRKLIFQPRFKQILTINPRNGGTLFHHILVALTKVYLFPYPKFSNTIYLTDLDEGLIPVGYAVYY